MNQSWESTPVRTQYQYDRGRFGGEGMQMCIDMDWNENNTDVVYQGIDTTGLWKYSIINKTWQKFSYDLPSHGINSVVSDPNNAHLVWAVTIASEVTSSNNGLWKTLDSGKTWFGPIMSFSYYKSKRGKLILIDDSSYNGTESTKVFVGTYNGIYNTSDGINFQHLALSGHIIRDIEWSRNNKSDLYVATNKSLYKVNLGDSSVTEIGNLSSPPYDCEFRSDQENVMWCVTGGRNGSFKSVNYGNTFIRKVNGVASGALQKNWNMITISPSNPDYMIASMGLTGGNVPYYTKDGGENWYYMDMNESECVGDCTHYYSKKAIYNPKNESEIFFQFGDTPSFSTNGGELFQYAGNGYTGMRLKDVAWINETEWLLCATDYGVFKTTSSGAYYDNMNLIRGVSENAQSCGSITYNGSSIFAATGGWYSQDIAEYNGTHWGIIQEVGLSIDVMRFNPNNFSELYAGRNVSYDGGVTFSSFENNWTFRGMNTNDGSHIFFTRMYSNDKYQVGESFDSGRTITQLGGNLTAINTRRISYDPFNESTHLLVGAGQSGVNEYYGGNWKLHGSGDGLMIGNSSNYAVAEFDPINKGVAYIGKYGYKDNAYNPIYRSTDGLKTWTVISNNIGPYNEMWYLNFNPFDDSVWVTADDGIFRLSPSCACDYYGVWEVNASEICDVKMTCKTHSLMSIVGSGAVTLNKSVEVQSLKLNGNTLNLNGNRLKVTG